MFDSESGKASHGLRVTPALAEKVRVALNTNPADGTVLRSNAVLVFSNTPPVLRSVGIPDTEIISDVARVRKMNREHGLTAEQIAAFPCEYSEPVAVFKEENSSYAIITSLLANNKKGVKRPVIVYLRPKSGKLGDTFIVSAYAPEAEKEAHYQNYAKSENVLYLDKEKAARIDAQDGLSPQLTPEHQDDGFLGYKNRGKWR